MRKRKAKTISAPLPPPPPIGVDESEATTAILEAISPGFRSSSLAELVLKELPVTEMSDFPSLLDARMQHAMKIKRGRLTEADIVALRHEIVRAGLHTMNSRRGQKPGHYVCTNEGSVRLTPEGAWEWLHLSVQLSSRPAPELAGVPEVRPSKAEPEGAEGSAEAGRTGGHLA